MAMYLGPNTALFAGNPNTAQGGPLSGDMRMNTALNCMEVYTGSSWTPLSPGWEQKESLADSVLHAADTIAMYIEEDYSDNATIQDAYADWLAATERFRVILTMAEK